MLNYPINPKTVKQEDLFGISQELINQFLSKNNLAFIPISIKNNMKNMGMAYYYQLSKRKTLEYYEINVTGCSPLSYKPNFRHGFPGYKEDSTVIGVVAHEVGHCINYRHGTKNNRAFGKVMRAEPALTSYEPNILEGIAESLRLFITNPDLLQQGRPLRYKYIIETFGLVPLFEHKWDEILQHADERIIKAGENWINRSKKKR